MINTRALFKSILANSFLYDFAKGVYAQYKVSRDRDLFTEKYPNAKYIYYSVNQIAKQRSLGFHSQFGQDFFLWNYYLKNVPESVFVDIGANKPKTNSNSFFLETKGWKGIAIDPIKHFAQSWQKTRDTPLINGAVSDIIGEEDFIEILPKIGWEHALSGFKRYVRKEDLNIYQYKEYKVPVKPLSEYLDPTVNIELMLIDVEGAEMQVLKGIDFSVFSPRYLLVENDSIFGGCNLIRKHLVTKGYECVARIAATDDLFILTDKD
jgi:FkbM family methyltransferase